MAITKGRKSTSRETSTLKIGDAAPEFELKSQLGPAVKLSDYKGKNVVIAFYPFAFTAV